MCLGKPKITNSYNPQKIVFINYWSTKEWILNKVVINWHFCGLYSVCIFSSSHSKDVYHRHSQDIQTVLKVLDPMNLGQS